MSKSHFFLKQFLKIAVITLFSSLTGCFLVHPVQHPETAVPVRTSTVKIVNFVFMPSRIIVARGKRVTWTNYDSVSHTATSNDGIFNSGKMTQGQSYSYVFKRRGIFYYHCIPHPSMRGIVEVR